MNSAYKSKWSSDNFVIFLKFKACNDAKIPLVHEFTAIAFFTLSFFLTSSSNLCVILPEVSQPLAITFLVS